MTVLPEDVEQLSPLGYDHINLLGRYTFHLSEEIRQGALRPLCEAEDLEDAEQAKEPLNSGIYTLAPPSTGERSYNNWHQGQSSGQYKYF